MASRGFTLLEVLVVVALMAVIASLAAPLLVRAVSGAEAQVWARQVAATLRNSRSLAIIENRNLAVTVDIDDRSIRIDDGAVKRLPDSLHIRVSSARSEQEDTRTAGIRFFPDGSSTGGEIILQDAKSIYHVQIEWLTGQVAIVKGTADESVGIHPAGSGGRARLRWAHSWRGPAHLLARPAHRRQRRDASPRHHACAKRADGDRRERTSIAARGVRRV
jgi:general secretion pathway protein H